MIGIATPIHARQRYVRLQAPSGPSTPDPPPPDGDGGYQTPPLTDLDPAYLFAQITPVAGDVDRLEAGTVLTSLSQLVKLQFHPAISLSTVLTWTDDANRPHVANVVSVRDVDGRGAELELTVSEIASQ